MKVRGELMKALSAGLKGALYGIIGSALYTLVVQKVTGLEAAIFSPRWSVEWYLVLPFGSILGASTALALYFTSTRRRTAAFMSNFSGGLIGSALCASFIAFLACCQPVMSGFHSWFCVSLFYGPWVICSAGLLAHSWSILKQRAPQ